MRSIALSLLSPRSDKSPELPARSTTETIRFLLPRAVSKQRSAATFTSLSLFGGVGVAVGFGVLLGVGVGVEAGVGVGVGVSGVKLPACAVLQAL